MTVHSTTARGDPSPPAPSWTSSTAKRPPLAPALPCSSIGVIMKSAGAPASSDAVLLVLIHGETGAPSSSHSSTC